MAEVDLVSFREAMSRLEALDEPQRHHAGLLFYCLREQLALGRDDLIKLPRYWQLLVIELAGPVCVFSYPTWIFHAGLGKWAYTPEPAWENPGYCERCGPGCAHCSEANAPKEADGTPLVGWDKVGVGWHCAGDNDQHMIALEGGDIAWPDPGL